MKPEVKRFYAELRHALGPGQGNGAGVVNAATRLHASQLLEAGAMKTLAGTMYDYLKMLREKGIKELGSGANSMVFQHPTMRNVVVKLLIHKDAGYLAWVKFCQKNQSNPYVPKIHNVVDTKNVFDSSWGLKDLHLVFLEKLRPMLLSQYERFAKYCSKLAMENPTDSDPGWGSGYFDANDKMDLTDFWVDVSRSKGDKALLPVAKFLASPPPGSKLDVRKPNLMLRGKQVVFSDPFSD